MNAREFAERALLGVLLTEPAPLAELAGWLRPEDFHRPAHQLIYRELRDMVADARPSPVDPSASDHARDASHDPARYALAVYQRIQASGDDLTARAITPIELVTLVQTAPLPSTAQPAQYGLMVVEASIRRGLAEDGMRVAQVAESADLHHMLDAVEHALSAVEQAQQRWEQVSSPAPSRPRLLTDALPSARQGGSAERIAGSSERIEIPDDDRVSQAEGELLGAVLAHPKMLDRLAGWVLPEDFADPRAGASYRAALHVHAEAAATGRRVDPVTVAWQQQRDQGRFGAGAEPEVLLALANTVTTADPMYSAGLILRASLARRVHAAAAAVQSAAQHPDLHPPELLRTARATYTSIATTAARMAGQGSTAAQLAAMATPVPIEVTLRSAAAARSAPSGQRAEPQRPRQRGRPYRPPHAVRNTGREP